MGTCERSTYSQMHIYLIWIDIWISMAGGEKYAVGECYLSSSRYSYWESLVIYGTQMHNQYELIYTYGLHMQ